MRVRRKLCALAVGASLALLASAAPAGAVIVGEFGLQKRAVPAHNSEPLQYHAGPVLHSSDSYAIYWDPIERYRFDWRRVIDEYFQQVGAASGGLGDVFAVNAQYGDGSGRAANQSTFRGAYTDLTPYPTSGCGELAAVACLSDEQIRTELAKIVASGALPGATGPAVYYLLTPPGVTVCTGGGSPSTCSNSAELESKPETGICGYHSVINPGAPAPIIYVVQPWVAGDAGQLIESYEPLKTSSPTKDVLACQDGGPVLKEPNQAIPDKFNTFAQGLADVIINGLSAEQSNVVVDPLLNGWYQTSTSAEQADMCQRNFGPPPENPPAPDKKTHATSLSNQTIGANKYYIQWGFDSVGLTSTWGYYCWQGVALEPRFTSPNPVNAGDVVGFDASESDITLNANTIGLPPSEPYSAPVYTWNFGDGTNAVSTRNAAPVFHSYQYGGPHEVTLTVTDSGGNTASVSKSITVVGPLPPAAAGSGSGASAGGQGGGGSSKGSVRNPGASASIVSRSLRTVLRGGLVVRYSVNEQVAGHFDVLLATSIAHRIGLHGPPATGLPQGTAPQTIIGKALVVTTKGGHSTLKIQFGKATASRLRRLHKVSLMLRLVVRSASTGTTTVLSTVTLSA
jgi:hypothetical protein